MLGGLSPPKPLVATVLTRFISVQDHSIKVILMFTKLVTRSMNMGKALTNSQAQTTSSTKSIALKKIYFTTSCD